MTNNISPIKEAITQYYGAPCDEFDPECACCQAWQDFHDVEREREAYRNTLVALLLVTDRMTATTSGLLMKGLEVIRGRAIETLDYWSAGND